MPEPHPTARTRPPHLSPAQFDRALRAFADALGPEGFLGGSEQIAEYRDPFAHASWRDYDPSAVLCPATVEEVQEILRIANDHKVPLWTSSQGRNNGYGGAAPRVGGSVVLSLRRMNRVLQVDEESAWALIEPGVRFFDLYDHLRG